MGGTNANIFLDGEVAGYNPDQNGDYRTIGDLQYDHNYMQNKLAEALIAISNNTGEEFFIFYGGEVSDSGGGQIDISAGMGIGKNENGDVRIIEIPALTNIDLPSGWKDDRQIWIVGYHEWILNSGTTRNHATTGESYHPYVDDGYKGQSDSDDLFVDSDPNSVSEVVLCWGSFQMSALDVFTDLSSGERTRIYGESFDTLEVDHLVERTVGHGVDVEGVHFEDSSMNGTFYVSTQADFDALIEEVSGTQWQFIDAVTSVVMNNLSGGYQMDDDDDYLETNNCKSIEMRGGAYIDFNDGIGYVKVNTDDCYLRNVDVKGNGSAGAVVQSFLLAANRVTFDNCKVSNRNSNVDMVGFQGSGTALHNQTSKYVNCSVYTLDGSDKLYGWKDAMNVSNSMVYDLASTGDMVDAFNNVDVVTNCTVLQLDTTTNYARAFQGCEQVSNCKVEDLDSPSSRAFSECFNISNCRAIDITSNASSCYAYYNSQMLTGNYAYNVSGDSDIFGYYGCEEVTGCYVYDINLINGGGGDAMGFSNCRRIAGCHAYDIDNDNSAGGNRAIGFNSCVEISACKANYITSGYRSYGFQACTFMSSCSIDNISSTDNAYGISACSKLSGCYVTGVSSTSGTAEGFVGCSFVSSVDSNEPNNSSNDYVDTDDVHVTNKYSTPTNASAVWD